MSAVLWRVMLEFSMSPRALDAEWTGDQVMDARDYLAWCDAASAPKPKAADGQRGRRR